MDLKKQKPSKNFEDHTGYSSFWRSLDLLGTLLNPVYMARKARDRRIETGQLIPEDRAKVTGGLDIDALIRKGILNKIRREDALINPKVLMDGRYGDLIPKSRWDQLGR